MSVLSGGVYDYVCLSLPNVVGNYFEIGVFNGTGFARIAKTFPDRQCYALDPFIEDGHTIASSGMQLGSTLVTQKQNFLLNTDDLLNVTLFELTSEEFEKNFSTEQCQKLDIGMVVIDGNHHYNNVVIDFQIALKLLGNNQGIIVVDDTDIVGVGQAYGEFLQQNQSRVQHLSSPSGSIKVLHLGNYE